MSSSSSRSPSTVTMAYAGSLPHGTSEIFAARAEVLQRDSPAAKCKMDLNLSPMCPSSLSANWLRSRPQRRQNDDQRIVHYCPLSLLPIERQGLRWHPRPNGATILCSDRARVSRQGESPC